MMRQNDDGANALEGYIGHGDNGITLIPGTIVYRTGILSGHEHTDCNTIKLPVGDNKYLVPGFRTWYVCGSTGHVERKRALRMEGRYYCRAGT